MAAARRSTRRWPGRGSCRRWSWAGATPTSAAWPALAIAEQVLCNQINRFIVNFIQAQGCEAMGLHSLSSNVLFAEKTYLAGPDGRRIDLGFVGGVRSVNSRLAALR